MPTRILREGILTSENVDRLSLEAELFFRRLMSVVDDYGRYSRNLSLLRAAAFPLRIDRVSSGDVDVWLTECHKAGLLRKLKSRGKECIEIVNFKQRIRTPSKYPIDGDLEPGNRDDSKTPTNDGQLPSLGEDDYRRRVSKASTKTSTEDEYAHANARVGDSGLVFDRSDLLGSVERMLGEREMKKNGSMWRMRLRSSPKALGNAIEDFYVRTPAQQSEIHNRAAWLTDRYERCLGELKSK